MIWLEAAFLTCMISTGVICAGTDLKDHIVSNKVLLIALGCSAVLHVISICNGMIAYYPVWILNLLIGSFIAIAMYATKMWAAGDTKLFITLYTFVFPGYLDGQTFVYSVIPYIYIFVPALIWVLCDTAFRMIRKEEKRRVNFNLKQILSNIVIVFINTTSVYYVITAILPFFAEQNALLIAVIMIAYGYASTRIMVLKKPVTVAIHIIVLSAVLLITGMSLQMPDWRTYLSIAAVLFIQWFTSAYNYQRISSDKVQKGMILSADTVFLFQRSRIHHLPTDLTEELTARISEEEAEAVRKWAVSVNGQENVWIVRKIPFAFMVALGFVLWIIILLAR